MGIGERGLLQGKSKEKDEATCFPVGRIERASEGKKRERGRADGRATGACRNSGGGKGERARERERKHLERAIGHARSKAVRSFFSRVLVRFTGVI